MMQFAVKRPALPRRLLFSFPAGIAGVALLGTFLILLRELNWGVGLWFDSISYSLRARRMLAGS